MARAVAEAKGRAAGKAADDSVDAAKDAVGLKVAELRERVADADPVGRVQSVAGDLGGRLQSVSGDLADRLADRVQAASGELVERVQVASGDFAGRVRDASGELTGRVRDAEPMARVSAAGSDLAQRVRSGADEAGERLRAARSDEPSDEQMSELLTLLGQAQVAGTLEQPKRKRRRWPLLLLLGIAAGVAWWLRRSQGQPEDDPYTQSAEWLAQAPPAPAQPDVEPPGGPAPSGVPSTPPSSSTTLQTANEVTVDFEMPVVTGPVATEPVEPGGHPLAVDIRTELDGDPRTAGLVDLAINVSDSTVFVRGNVPAGFDPTTIRDVIAAVPGVTDVDMQVTYT